MAITLTAQAAEHIKTMLAKRGKGEGLRFGAKPDGCSGYSYLVDYADSINDDDEVFAEHGVKIVVAEKSLPLVDGTEIDFVSKGLNSAFEFHNPKADASCGCGESFSIKNGDESND
jgi:iron-sulfur cluster assembly protein